MKQKDIALIVAVAGFAGIASFILSGVFFSGNDKVQKVEVVQTITTEFDPNDERYDRFFNDKAINPTKLIRIGDTNNPKPF